MMLSLIMEPCTEHHLAAGAPRACCRSDQFVFTKRWLKFVIPSLIRSMYMPAFSVLVAMRNWLQAAQAHALGLHRTAVEVGP